MSLKSKAISISKLLSKILFDAVVFNKEKHFKLIELLIETIKILSNSKPSLFCKLQTATVLIEVIADFLYRLKDRHPYSNPKEKTNMDVFYTIMEFLIPNGYLPSPALLKEYAESKLTKKLNTLPSREYLNSKFDKNHQLSEEDYKKIRKIFESRPPFVFNFNPDIELQETVEDGWRLKIGFFEKGTDDQIGAGMYVWSNGRIYQGYSKNNFHHIYGREIYDNGNSYEGGFDMDYRHGK